MKKDIFVFSFVALYCVSCKEMEKKGASFFSSSVRGVAVVSLFFFSIDRGGEKRAVGTGAVVRLFFIW